MYDFRKLTVDDLELLMEWQSRPHVRRWWDFDQPYDEDKINDPRVARWIVSTNDRAFGFIQDYTVHGWDGHHFEQFPKGTRGIDQYIGDPDMIGLGHGSAFIAARMRLLFDEGAPAIVTDPHPENYRAITVYEKLGFEAYAPPQETKWGLILQMKAVAI